jgi:hypothetical protein
VGTELSWAHDRTVFDQSNSNGAATGAIAPDHEQDHSAQIVCRLRLDKQSNVRFDLIHEKWNSNDWQWLFTDGKPWQFGAVGTDGTTVITTPNQNSTL